MEQGIQGRPLKGKERGVRRRIYLSLSDKEHKFISSKAGSYGIKSLSNYCRLMALGEIQGFPKLQTKGINKARHALQEGLPKLANNLNQLVRRAHQDGADQVADEALATLRAIQSLVQKASRYLDQPAPRHGVNGGSAEDAPESDQHGQPSAETKRLRRAERTRVGRMSLPQKWAHLSQALEQQAEALYERRVEPGDIDYPILAFRMQQLTEVLAAVLEQPKILRQMKPHRERYRQLFVKYQSYELRYKGFFPKRPRSFSGDGVAEGAEPSQESHEDLVGALRRKLKQLLGKLDRL